MFKIESLKLAETAEFEVTHPLTGEVLEDEAGNKVILTMHGSASPKHRTAVEKLLRKKNNRGKRDATFQESRADNIEFLVDLSISITNLEYDGIEGVEGKDRFNKLYGDEGFSWLRDFANSKAGSVEGFLKQ
jgi:hypothetical protein